MRIGNGNEGFTPITVTLESEEEFRAVIACLEVGCADEYLPDGTRWCVLELVQSLLTWRGE
jgi:hypothetical protein